MSIKNLSSDPTKAYQDLNVNDITAATVTADYLIGNYTPPHAQTDQDYSVSTTATVSLLVGRVGFSSGPTIANNANFDVGMDHPEITSSSIILIMPYSFGVSADVTQNWIVISQAAGSVTFRVHNTSPSSQIYSTFGFNYWIIP